MNLSGIEEAVSLAERRWPGLVFHITGDESHSACPFEREGDDRFAIFADGGYWCRRCAKTGWLDDQEKPHILTPAERNALEIRKLKRRQAKTEQRLSALERMARCADHLTYHKLLDQADRDYWHSQGMTNATIDKYMLGICYACPTDREHRPSWTIPVINRGNLVNIRHRLIDVESGDRYRPHMAGLGATLFNADHLYTGADSVLVCEGEKKSIVTSEHGFASVGLMGMRSFPPAWAVRFEPFKVVHVVLDPDAQAGAQKVAGLFGGRGQVVTLPCKADDFFVGGGTAREFAEFLRLARRVD